MKLEQRLYQEWATLRKKISFSHKKKGETLLQKIKHCQEETKSIALQEQFRKYLSQTQSLYQQKQSLQREIPFDQSLPIYQRKEEIQKALQKYQVVIVCGDTGSGKTTQLPLFALELGYGVKAKIGCTQPRRIAATSIANRVAEVMKTPLGDAISYEVRFDKKVSEKSMIKFMTDGILLAETQNDLKLFQYEVLIIDEAHERSLNIDFILGYLKEILSIRSDLKILISSATLEAKKFSEFFDNAPVFQVEGRSYPIEDFYLQEFKEEDELEDLVHQGVNWVTSVDSEGDILVFLPGEKEIFDCEKKLEGERFTNTIIMPLYARLSFEDQQKIFKPSKQRKIILATNVAETSLTINGIRYVIDSGLARVSRYSANSQIQRLQTEWVSQSNVKQRRGRCGRTQEGICYHLYTKEIYEEMAEFPDPEIRRSGLAGIILQMKKLKLKDINEFAFIDVPNKKMVQSALQTLFALGALDTSQTLTKIGENLLLYPLDPHLGRMILHAIENGALHEILILVAVLSAQDPRERPANASQEDLNKQKKWDHKNSDFLSLLNLWQALKEAKESSSNNQFRKFLKEHFISYRKLEEWKNIYRELYSLMQANKLTIGPIKNDETTIHQCLLSGLPSMIAYLDDTKTYRGYGGQEVFVFPGSVLFKKNSKYIFCFALVETTKLYARTVAECDPIWFEKLFPHLCRYHYSESYWNENQGCPYAIEHVSISGYPEILKRSVNYGRIDAIASRKIFIQEALIEKKIHSKAPALRFNQKIVQRLKELEVKSRRIDCLYHEPALYEFFNTHLPQDIHTTKQFEKWYYQNSKINEDFLVVSEDALLIPQLEHFSVDEYPDSFNLYDHKLKISYYYAPNHSHDGHTLHCPLHLLSQLRQAHLDWAVMGFLSEKSEELFKTLPKNLRIALQPMGEWVKGFLDFHINKENTLIDNLICYSKEKYKVDLSPEAFQPFEIPPYLIMRVLVLDEKQNKVGEERILSELKSSLKIQAEEQFTKVTDIEIHIDSWSSWKKNAFPFQTIVKTKLGELHGYAALTCENNSLSIKVYADEITARHAHKLGLIRVFEIEHKDMVSYLYQNYPISRSTSNYFKVLTGNAHKFEEFLALRTIEHALRLEEELHFDPDEFKIIMLEGRTVIATSAETFGKILEDSYETCQQISKILDKCIGPAFQKSLKHFEEFFQLLFSENTFFYFSSEFILMLNKICKGFLLRIERIKLNPLKDAQKIDLIQTFYEKLDNWQKVNSNLTKPILNTYIQNLLLFHSSVFAQEVRLPRKSSPKILEENIFQIESFLKK